ncbi:MAG: hypothetical protein V3R98_02300 [Alphaproteobacteria bacterium]
MKVNALRKDNKNSTDISRLNTYVYLRRLETTECEIKLLERRDPQGGAVPPTGCVTPLARCGGIAPRGFSALSRRDSSAQTVASMRCAG